MDKRTRQELRRRCPTPEETDALLDLADERDRYRALLEEALRDARGEDMGNVWERIDAVFKSLESGSSPHRIDKRGRFRAPPNLDGLKVPPSARKRLLGRENAYASVESIDAALEGKNND